MSQENMDAEQTLELYVLDYLVTRNLLQTAMSLVREANITGDTQSVPYQPGRGLLRGWWDLHTPILGPNDCLAAAYAQFSALTSVRVPSSREQLKHFDAHGVSLPQPQADGQLQSIPGGGSITQHIQGTGIVDNFNVVEMPSLMHGASTMPTNYFGLGGAGSDQGTGGFQPGWGVPPTGTHGNMDPLGAINIFLNDGLDEKVSREIISQKRLKNQALAQQPQHHQQHQYSQQSRMAASQQQQLQYQQQQQNLQQSRMASSQQQQLQYQQQQQNLQQSRMASSQQQQLQYQQQQQNLQQLRGKKQQQQQELLQEQQKQQLLQEQRKQQVVKQAFAQQPQVQLQQQEARKRRKPTSATEAGTSKNPVGHFYPAPPLRPSIGTPVGRFLLAGDSGTPAGPTAPTLMTPGLPLAGDNRRYLIDIDTLRDAGLLPAKQQGAKSTGSEDSVTSRNPDDPLAPSTGTPGVELSMARDSGNPVDPPAPSTGTPDVGLSLARDSRNPVNPPAPSIGTSGVGLSLARAPSTGIPGVGLSLIGNSRNPVDPPAPSTITPGVRLSLPRDSGNPLGPSSTTPGVRLSLPRDSGNPLGPSSTATPGDGLPSARNFPKGSGT